MLVDKGKKKKGWEDGVAIYPAWVAIAKLSNTSINSAMTTPFYSSSATLSHNYNSLAPNVIPKFAFNFNPFIARPGNTSRSSRIKASSFSSSPYPTLTENEKALSIDALQTFIQLNLGNWIGSFYVSVCVCVCVVIHSYMCCSVCI